MGAGDHTRAKCHADPDAPTPATLRSPCPKSTPRQAHPRRPEEEGRVLPRACQAKDLNCSGPGQEITVGFEST